MVWTSFWTGTLRYAYSNFGVHHNPIFIELPLGHAIKLFETTYGRDAIKSAGYVVQQASSIEEATAFYRGCVIRDVGFLEESRADRNFPYFSINKFLKQKGVLLIPNTQTVKPDGAQCANCKDFVLWAAPNQASGQFVCRACVLNPYR